MAIPTHGGIETDISQAVLFGAHAANSRCETNIKRGNRTQDGHELNAERVNRTSDAETSHPNKHTVKLSGAIDRKIPL